MAELKPCPFCGGEAEIWEDKVFVTFIPQCKECKAQRGRYINKENAIKAWNTRKPMEAVVAELEKEITIVEGERTEDIPITRFLWNQALAKAIEIVRGKE